MSRSVHSLITTTAALALTVALWPSDLEAQPPRTAQPRPPVVHSPARVYRPYYYPYHYPYYYSPFYYGFSWGLGFGWGPYGWYPYGPYPYGPYPYPYHYGYYNESSLRIQVKPNNAEVYVDGYFMGLVDSYDGMFQRLHLPPGEHVVEIFHEGYRSLKETMRFAPREGYELKRVMEPVAPGDPAPVRPKPDPAAQQAEPETRDMYGRRPDTRVRVEEPGDRPGDVRSADSGAVAIRVQPAGALVLIDGEKWEGPGGPERLVIHLSEGTHRVEIQKEGYRPFVTEVRIRRGETVPLNISLRTGG